MGRESNVKPSTFFYWSDVTKPAQWVVMLLKWRYKASTVSGHVIEVTVQRQDSEWSCYWSDCTNPGQLVVMLLKWLYNARTVSGHVCLLYLSIVSQFLRFDSVTQMHDCSLSCLGTYTSMNSGGIKPVFWVQTSVHNNMVMCGYARVCTCESSKYIRNHKY